MESERGLKGGKQTACGTKVLFSSTFVSPPPPSPPAGLRPNASSLPDIDAAQNLGGWAVAALCRSMSLDNLLTFLTAALLERQARTRGCKWAVGWVGEAAGRGHAKPSPELALTKLTPIPPTASFLHPSLFAPTQIVVFCPNAGLLSGIVLSLVPLLLPFHWQSLLLPVLPAAEGRLELMEARRAVHAGLRWACCGNAVGVLSVASSNRRLPLPLSSPLLQAPVPFVLGVLYKTPEVRAKCGGLVRCVCSAGALPPPGAPVEGSHAGRRRAADDGRPRH